MKLRDEKFLQHYSGLTMDLLQGWVPVMIGVEKHNLLSHCQGLSHIVLKLPSDIRSVPHLAQLVQDMQGISPLLCPATAVDHGIEDQELWANGRATCLRSAIGMRSRTVE